MYPVLCSVVSESGGTPCFKWTRKHFNTMQQILISGQFKTVSLQLLYGTKLPGCKPDLEAREICKK